MLFLTARLAAMAARCGAKSARMLGSKLDQNKQLNQTHCLSRNSQLHALRHPWRHRLLRQG
jgi:hypothetical protein